MRHCWLLRRPQWESLEHEWPKALSKFGFQLGDFHAKDFVGRPQRKQLLKALSHVISKHAKINPVSFGVVVDDFKSFSLPQRKFLTGATLKRKKLVTTGCPNKPYFVPFQLCIKRVTDYAPVGGKAHFFFGLDRPFAGYATSLFAQVKNNLVAGSDWKSKDRLGDPAFPLASETPQLQAADLLVHLTYQYLLDRLAAGGAVISHLSPLFAECLRNKRAVDDHAFQDKRCMQQTLLLAKQKAGVDWMEALEEGL